MRSPASPGTTPFEDSTRAAQGARAREHQPSGSRRAANVAWLRAALVAMLVVAADQLSKHLLEDSLRLGAERKLLPGLAFVNTRNHGVAFGVEPGSSLAVSVVIALALLALLIYFVRHSTRPLLWLPTGLLFGGAVGNIIDRVRQGAVTDFIKLPLGWPPFNIADASITIGVIVLVLLLARDDRQRRQATS
jgi:signal peptidase II